MSGRPTFDIHVHLAGVGTQGSGCWTSDAFRRRPTFLGLRLLYGISGRQMRTSIDQDWPARISSLTASSSIDYSVVLGFDGVYDHAGSLDRSRSQLIVPDDWVFEVCDRYANLLPAPSINPLDRRAGDRLERAIERGAVMIKWLPIVQGFDPADERVLPFLRRVADAGIPVLVHAGTGESTFAVVDDRVGSLRSLVPALEAGVRVIAAHTAAPVVYSRAPSEIPILRELLNTFENLWVDNSGLANPARFPWLPRFADDALIASRTLHGSDFPVTAGAIYYPRRLGLSSVVAIQREANPIERELLLKRSIGVPPESLTRAGDVLANLDRWG